MSTSLVKKQRLWERWATKGETVETYDLFLAYFSLGSGRSLTALAAKVDLALNYIQSLATPFQWSRRAKAYDSYLRNLQLAALEKQVKSEGALWVQRESEYRHESYHFARELQAKAKEMLASPLYTTEKEEYQDVIVGDQVVQVKTLTIIKPVRWSFKDLSSFADVSDKLMRLSLGVPTSRSAVDVNVSASLPERITTARAAMALWIERDLNSIIERILNDDPSQDASEIRNQLLAQAPEWFAKDYAVPDPAMLVDVEEYEGEEPSVSPLMLDEETDVVN